ncbi:MAG TPA: PSD1 and planctomycete cytochrome C domain-containing protein, partial [Planctomycetaceae bacterium]|nr:PSD1 and planctomycete cytochrome C domain-containing protein [Planctomycetaceae bacterium]
MPQLPSKLHSMRFLQHRILLLIVCCSLWTSTHADEADSLFENNIRPVLAGTCFRCHGDGKTSGMLRVDSREALLTGGDSGPAIVPGKPEESLLIRAIRGQDDVSAMPPEKEQTLRPDQIAAFQQWIKDGALWPQQSRKFEGHQHWSFQLVRNPERPVVGDTAWVKNSIDAFIRAKQEAAGVRPTPAADKLTLIRRATFDLTGLPPTPNDIDAFLADSSPQAFENVVDRLLKSPHYGEHWGRHWLDVVRYADTAGETADYPVPLAWRYRNYVIDAFNADKPYDQFLKEQIAGDILAADEFDAVYAEQVTATGYLAISRRFGFDSENYHHLTIQDTIDTLGQSVLGLSLGCARCHDHKFDALSMMDYYGLYGIFDSSRYAFPGSEQKQKFRSMVPLLPPAEAMPKWREFEQQVAAMADSLEKRKQPVPTAILRSLNDIDGDFEMQAPAAGGSNGVLVPPWLYEGKIAVTTAAQSPFKNLYLRGKVGASLAAGAGRYRIAQSLYPRRTADNCDTMYFNLDFRIGSSNATTAGAHRFRIGAFPDSPAVVLLISPETVSLQIGDAIDPVAAVTPNAWHNIQLSLNLRKRTVSGTISTLASLTKFDTLPLSRDWNGTVDFVELDSSEAAATIPAFEFDNLGVQEQPMTPASKEIIFAASPIGDVDTAQLMHELQELVGLGGDFELQAIDAPPTTPWNPGPNSVVKISAKSQSPFANMYPVGTHGIHMPNRAEYDGFGLTLPKPWLAQDTKQLFASFDFCCADVAVGGDGSWRFYMGHGPGNSAAVELFFNGKEFFRRSADAREAVTGLTVGEWYQVQLQLDLQERTYSGTLTSPTSAMEFIGQLASGWDGTIDYSFIDSYGHLGGVRPGLDIDNYEIADHKFPSFDATPRIEESSDLAERRNRADEIRKQLAELQYQTQQQAQQLQTLLSDGPFPMTYGMAEGTPHDVTMQLRGEPSQPGDVVPRGFIRALGGERLPSDTRGSGRLELANWLTRPENPLTARVMVNRIWQYHFGRGLVKTPNDFGVRGLPPTHPDLLDHLATQFIQSGWSIKTMHRAIMLSATYQQSAGTETSGDDLYTHFARRRLSAEEIRDTILMVTRELDPEPGQGHPFPSPISWGFSQHGPFNAVYDHNKRSVYLMTQRLKRHPFLALFDGPDTNASTPDRLGTTVPTQALYFLNDPFV